MSTLQNVDKLIIIDFSVYLHRAVFSLKFNPSVPATYTAMSMIISSLGRIGVTPDTTIMMVMDGRKSWRKDIETEYKGNRKEHRDASGIDWNYWFVEFSDMVDRIREQMNWVVIGPIEHIEADDLASVACRYFTDVPEIVLVTIDSDWEQMWIYDNVRIFNISTKEWKLKPREYNVYQELAKKVKKEASDNLVTLITTDEDYDKRLMCVDLTRLPEWVENICVKELSEKTEHPKNIEYNVVPIGRTTLQARLDSLYNSGNIISYDDQLLSEAYKEAKSIDNKKEAKAKLIRKKNRMLLREKKIKISQRTTKTIKGVKNDQIY